MLIDDRELRKATLYAKLIYRLKTAGGTYLELAEYTGLSYHTVIRYIKALREYRLPDDKSHRMVRIADWRKDDKDVARLRVFRMEWGRDVKQPRVNAAEKQRRYRANKLSRHRALPNSVFALGK